METVQTISYLNGVTRVDVTFYSKKQYIFKKTCSELARPQLTDLSRRLKEIDSRKTL